MGGHIPRHCLVLRSNLTRPSLLQAIRNDNQLTSTRSGHAPRTRQ
jgi:hypothetical protein